MAYDALLEEAEKYGAEVLENSRMRKFSGLCVGNVIVINKNLNQNEKTCVLAEELGHYLVTVGNILDQTKTENRKQEFIARRWAVRKLIRLEDLFKAYKAGVRDKAELAEFLNVTEQFLDMAIEHFKNIYGLYCRFGNYIIGFDPLMIYKRIEGE